MFRKTYLQKISFGKPRPICRLENDMGDVSVLPLFVFHVAMRLLVWLLTKYTLC